MEWIFLVLAVAVLVFGIGVLVVNRRRSASVQAPTTPAPRPVAPPPKAPDVDGHRDGRRRRRGHRRRARAGQAGLAAPAARQGPRRVRRCVHGRARPFDDQRRDVDGTRGGAAAGRRRARRHRGAARRPAGAGEVEGDHRAGAAARRAAGRHGRRASPAPTATCTSTTRCPAGSPNVWMFVGVNGVGKTTSIGKVAQQQIDGRPVGAARRR